MQAPRPDPDDALDEENEIVQFGSEEEFHAWARENVADWEEFVKGSMDSIAQLHAWRDAGNAGFPRAGCGSAITCVNIQFEAPLTERAKWQLDRMRATMPADYAHVVDCIAQLERNPYPPPATR